jgi:hypothetical protein
VDEKEAERIVEGITIDCSTRKVEKVKGVRIGIRKL